MKLKRVLLLSLSVIMFMFFVSFISFGNSYTPVSIKIFLNQKQLVFDVPPINIDNRILVPVGSILRSMGADVLWDSSKKLVTASKGDLTVIIPINSNTAVRNNTSVKLDVPAKIISGRTFVPFRFLSESLGAKVHYDSINKSIFITSEENSFSFKGLSLGSSLEEVSKVLGKPKRIDISEYDFKWYIYHDNYKNYVQVGIRNNIVVAIYSNNPLWVNENGINVGSSKKAVASSLTKPLDKILKGNIYYSLARFKDGEEYQVHQLDNSYLTIFYDLHRNHQVTALQIVDKSIEEKYRRHLNTSTELKKAYERQVFDLANALRVREGLQPFIWCDLASISAEKHSKDMAINKYFNHNSLEGISPFDRMKKEGITYRLAGENIAAGQQNAIFAHEGWLNSFTGHREAIMGRYQRLGVGVWFGDDKAEYNNYYTQNFYTPF